MPKRIVRPVIAEYDDIAEIEAEQDS